MPWWRRRRPEPTGGNDTQRLVQLATQYFAERGYEVVHDGEGTLVSNDGASFGLHNLAVALRDVPSNRWPRVIDGHVEALVAARTTKIPRSLTEAEDKLVGVLQPVSDLAGSSWSDSGWSDSLSGEGSSDAELSDAVPDYAPEVLPGVVMLAALDHPTHVSTLASDESIEDLGPWSAIEPVVRRNLLALPTPTHRVIHGEQEQRGSQVHLLVSEDHFGASRVVVLHELLASVLRVERPTHGVLVAVPNRHLMVVHVIEDAAVLDALQLMVNVVRTQYEAEVGTVSPHLYYLPLDGPAEQITSIEAERTTIEARGALGETLRRLGVAPD